MGRFQNESEAADVVIGHLRDLKYNVYCEVQTGAGRIDIIAVQGKIITSVEVKNCRNFEVLSQAIHRWPYVNRSIAAFPFPKSQDRIVMQAVAKHTGIGIWDIKKNTVSEFIAPRLNRRPASKWITESLCEEQQNQKAGVNQGHWSPFRATKDRIVLHVRQNQPCTLKSTIEAIEHHYASDSSAYQSVGKWIRSGVIKEVEMTPKGLVLSQ